MDKAIRNTLRSMVTQARKTLEEAIQEQLQGVFGIHTNGSIEPSTAMTHLSQNDQHYREQILVHLQHIQASGLAVKDAVAQLVREVSYTHLNRLCAYKMMEKRKIIPETVSRGLKSRGFIFYVDEHPEEEQLWSGGKQDIAYRHFLEWRGEKLSEEIGVLFSPSDPANRLFPPQRVIDELLTLINSDELQDIWFEDETIGWVYQYFTPKELRDKSRKESRSPRNSYELAFRNQFYTPSYVVQFLTDNTLGRIWYEMRQGKTRLTEQCAYMVRRPDEVFFAKADSSSVEAAQRWLQGEDVAEPDTWALAHTVNVYNRVGSIGESGNEWVEKQLPRLTKDATKELKTQELLDLLFLFCRKERFCEGTLESLSNEIESIRSTLRERNRPANKENRSQEELLSAPFFISYRPMKDPRTLKILDPACGSGHFLLYCFDLLETIYLEAYEAASPDYSLKKDYPTLTALQRALPGLILTNNLHGIDIDLRATQIASLALWLRSQVAYQDFSLKSDERPKISRSNVVCAEPMPGEKDLLDEFTATLQPKILGTLVKTIFDKMRLANEAGSLLKIEVEIKEAILEAKQIWLTRPKAEQLALWYGSEKAGSNRIPYDEAEITDEAFWNEAEARVIEALRTYATSVSNSRGLARRLFSDDAVQGFAFIDICQKLFDVILMNPPFGEASKLSKTYIDRNYPQTKGDVLTNFIERVLDLCLPNGLVGAISSRTCFFLGTYSLFREEILRKKGHISIMADLGEGVLEAMVETAAYTLTKQVKQQNASLFFRELLSFNKGSSLLCSVENVLDQLLNENTFFMSTDEFSQLSGSPFAYWVDNEIIHMLTKGLQLEGNAGKVRVGLQTGDDNRLLRLIWEVPPQKIGAISDHYVINPNAFINKLRSTFKKEKRWAFYSKTDYASLWISPLTLVVDWSSDGDKLKEFVHLRGKHAPMPVIRSEELYFQPGFSYTRRSIRLVPYIVPAGVIPTAGRSQVYPLQSNEFALLGYCASNVASAVARFSGGMFARPMFQASMVQNLPVPTLSTETIKKLVEQIETEVAKRRSIIQGQEPYQEFTRPAFLGYLDNHSVGWNPLSLLGNRLEDEIANAFGLSSLQLKELERDIREAVAIREFSTLETETNEDENSSDVELVDESPYVRVEGLVSYCVGCAFGRWDIRIAKDEELAPKLQGVFDPLPPCPPGMLISPNGLPATSGTIVSEEWLRARPDAITLPEKESVKQSTISDSDYPLTINWDGILVDDPEHPEAIIRRLRDVLRVIWQDKADAIEQEACQILGVKELRDYFRKSGNGGFWTDHIQRYSKSHRKAPIYWLLQSSKKNYAVWLYYHRLNKDTLFRVLNTIVEPKLRLEETQLEQLRLQLVKVGTAGREAKQLERQLERQESFISELEDFRDKLRRAADLNLEPDLNDGVMLNIAPLWELVPWSEAKRYWQELQAGKYEWSTIGKQLRERGLV